MKIRHAFGLLLTLSIVGCNTSEVTKTYQVGGKSVKSGDKFSFQELKPDVDFSRALAKFCLSIENDSYSVVDKDSCANAERSGMQLKRRSKTQN
jgi:hypothetical protein